MGALDTPDVLVCRAGATLCALALDGVVETMRPLPIETLADTAEFVLGMSMVRSSPIPVVDARILLGVSAARAPSRWITLNVGDRRVALAVDEVLGVRRIDASILGGLPPLLGAVNADRVSAIAALDDAFVLVLRHARLIPEDALVRPA